MDETVSQRDKKAHDEAGPQERQRDPERTKAWILDASVEVFSARGYAGVRIAEVADQIDPDPDPSALMLMIMGAAHALTVYPHIARGLFRTTDAHDPDVIARYADEVAKVLTNLQA